MFLVLILHSGFSTVKSPTTLEVHEHFLQPFTRFIFESLSISCVDIFVLISGWFGIRPTKKGLLNFLFQSFYFIIGVYLVMVASGLTPISIKGITSCFLFIQDYDYWFVRTYLLLFIMSPILNAFVENANKKTYQNVLIGFFLFQTVYAWCFVAVNAFAGGYSTISFMGLYLLARYANIHNPKWSRMTKSKDLLVIVTCVVFMAAFSFATTYAGHPVGGKFYDSYICPLVILMSLFMVILFSKLHIQSILINWVAASCFAVYLFHTHITLFYDYFKHFVANLYAQYDSVLCLFVIGVFLLSVFTTAIVLDQPRKWMWNLIAKSL